MLLLQLNLQAAPASGAAADIAQGADALTAAASAAVTASSDVQQAADRAIASAATAIGASADVVQGSDTLNVTASAVAQVSAQASIDQPGDVFAASGTMAAAVIVAPAPQLPSSSIGIGGAAINQSPGKAATDDQDDWARASAEDEEMFEIAMALITGGVLQ